MTIFFRLFSIFSIPLIAVGAPVTVGDHSFEGNQPNNLDSGGWSNDLSPEWQESNGPNNGSGFEEFINNFAAVGTDHVGMNSNHEIWQDLGITYQANTTYTLTVALGNRSGQTSNGNQSTYSLRSSSNTSYASTAADASTTATAGNFADAPSLVFDTSQTPAAVGNTIRIHLLAGGPGRSHFDNIRLDATPNAPSGEAALSNGSAASITSTSATIGGTVTDIGDAAPSITLFYGTTDGGTNSGSWDSSITLPDTHSGAFSGNISGLSPAQTYFFSARATNSAGVSWASPAGSFETLANPATLTQSPAGSVTATSAELTATVTDTGGDIPTVVFYYGTSDGGTNPAAWANSTSLGQLNGAGSTTVTGLSQSTTYFFRARAVNSGGGSWTAASGNFTTSTVMAPTIENRSANSITGTSAAMRGEVTDNGSDTPTVTIFYGTTDGMNNLASWDSMVTVGPENGNFSRFVSGLTPETTYYYTSRAVNIAGTSWAPTSETFTTTAGSASAVVINEIHYDPLDETSAEEFIELYNPGTEAIDISNWQITDAVTFTIPAGTTIGSGEFIVIAEDPARISTVFGKTALGPWAGSLGNRGEEIDLRDSSGTLQDQVNYDDGFPWPTGARGGGGSMELLNPDLDNNLSGSWRVSGTVNTNPSITTYVTENDSGWSYRKGTSEASSPVDAWREINFTEDGTWLTGQAPFGYGDNDDNTVLSDMWDNYTSVYLRREFTVDPLNIPQQLTLRVYVDDGAIIWINGNELERPHVNSGQIPFNGTGNNHEAEWEEFTVSAAGNFLVGGTNVIAVHALNAGVGSTDFSIDVALSSGGGNSGGGGNPTPGEANSSFATLTPPAIRQIDHSPEIPTDADPVTITAKITDPDGMGAVTLDYQTVDPGSYIRKTDAAYETSWTTVTMVDDGTGGDAIAGDSFYTAVLPASLQSHRRLVRYRIHFEDANGASATVPYADDESPNFAYFVYNGVPSWTGSFTPSTSDETFPSSLMGSLPTYHLVANSTDVTNSQYNVGSDGIHFLGTLIYDGKVYDHIEFENRGEASTYVAGKNKWRIHFNRARRFAPRDNWGEKYGRKWSKLNLQSISGPWAAVNRGMAGLDESLTMRLYGMAGLPSPRTHYFSFRVIDSANEAPSDQYAGDLWGLYLGLEQPNGSFLDERGLADGNIYKIEGGSGDKKEQGDTQVSSSSDWSTFYSASNSAQTEQWWRDNMDMPTYYSLRSLNRLLGNVDIRIGFNHYFYHEPTEDKWHVMPWDLDMMYIAETHQAGVIRQQNSINNHAQLAIEFRNRAREISDLVASDSSTTGGQIGQLIDEYAQIVNPTGQTLTWADVDALMWNRHPRTRGSLGDTSGQTNHLGNFYASPFTDSRFGGTYTRTLSSQDHEGLVQHILNYTTDTFSGGNWNPGNGVPAGYGYEYLNDEADDNNIPNKPTIAYSGPVGFPANQLSFTSGSFSDPNGNGSFGKMRWRIAKILAPGLPGYEVNTPRTYEIETLFQSPDILSFDSSYLFPGDPIEPGATYRVRVQHEDSTSRTSNWSDPVQFIAAAPSVTLWQDNLVISEVMYNPAQPTAAESLVSTDNDDFEFIELTNISQSVTLDLTDLDFSNGITFDFANASLASLAPGATVLLVKNQAAFEARYGNSLPVIGTYPNSLSNGGERVTLSFAQNTPIIDFTYSDLNPWPTSPDGSGLSLILIDPNSGPDHALATSWTGGSISNGTPGGLEPEGQSYADWLAENFTAGELSDPAISGDDADPDGDLLSNFLEYAFLTDPKIANDPSTLLNPIFVFDAGQTFLAFTFPQRDPAAELTYTPQVANDLQAWREGPANLVEISNIPQGNGSSQVTVRSTTPVSGQAKEFIRVKVTRTAP